MCGSLTRRGVWPLFAVDARFALGWSELRVHPMRPEDDEFYSFSGASDVEVGRVHLDLRPVDVAPWAGVSELGSAVVRIQLLEVAAGFRGRGLGRAIVQDVAALHPEARLVALSVPNATGFWSALGWSRFEHRREGPRLPLYLAPTDPATGSELSVVSPDSTARGMSRL